MRHISTELVAGDDEPGTSRLEHRKMLLRRVFCLAAAQSHAPERQSPPSCMPRCQEAARKHTGHRTQRRAMPGRVRLTLMSPRLGLNSRCVCATSSNGPPSGEGLRPAAAGPGPA